VSSPKEICWDPTIYYRKKQKKTKNKNKDDPRTTHSIWSNKNIVSWKMTWYFCWWRRWCLGHPKAWTLVLLGYFLGWHGHPQAWAFVSNVSIIFDAPCLFIHHLLYVLSTLRGVFYAFSRTNLLTRCHSVSSLFSAIFVFQKSYTGNILIIGQNKSWIP
jgi:hypothetical protein